MVGQLFQGLAGIATLVGLVCWIIVLIRMFQAGHTTPAIVALALLFCLLSPLFVFVYGWLKVNELGVRRAMTIWTVAWAISILSGGCGGILSNQIGFQ